MKIFLSCICVLQRVRDMGALNEISCITKLSAMQLKGDGGIKALFQEVNEYKLTLQSAGKDYPDSFYIPFIMKALPARYSSQKNSIRMETRLSESLDECMTYLEHREQEIAEEYQQEKAKRAAQQGLKMKPHRANAAFSNHQGDRGQREGGFRLICYNCNKPGHRASECRSPPAQHAHNALPAPHAQHAPPAHHGRGRGRGGRFGGRGHFRRPNYKPKYMGRANVAYAQPQLPPAYPALPAPAAPPPAHQPPPPPAPQQRDQKRVRFE